MSRPPRLNASRHSAGCGVEPRRKLHPRWTMLMRRSSHTIGEQGTCVASPGASPKMILDGGGNMSLLGGFSASGHILPSLSNVYDARSSWCRLGPTISHPPSSSTWLAVGSRPVVGGPQIRIVSDDWGRSRRSPFPGESFPTLMGRGANGTAVAPAATPRMVAALLYLATGSVTTVRHRAAARRLAWRRRSSRPLAKWGRTSCSPLLGLYPGQLIDGSSIRAGTSTVLRPASSGGTSRVRTDLWI